MATPIYGKPNYSVGVWANSGTIESPTTEKIALGHVVERPAFEISNWLENRQDLGIAYLFQQGIAEWDENFTYPINALVKRGSDVYRASIQNTGADPLSSSAVWRTPYVSIDNPLQGNINNEQDARIYNDNLLHGRIDYEITQRSNADADLDNRKFNKLGGTISGDVAINGNTYANKGLVISGRLSGNANPSSFLAIEMDVAVLGQCRFSSSSDIEEYFFTKPIIAPSITLNGAGQTWQDVTANRAIGITYTNSTNSPIQVYICVAGGSIRNKVHVDSVLIADQMSTYNTGGPIVGTSFIVPSGSAYRIDASGGLLQSWAELK